MPFVNSQGCRIYYRVEGSPSKRPLVLVHSLGADHGMWELQMPALLRYFQVLRVDLRGHGASDAPAGDYTISQLAEDVLAAVEAAGHQRFSYCGLSLGGMIGQWLAAKTGRIRRMVLANTSPRMADPSLFDIRRKTVLEQGMGAIVDAVMQRFFTARTLQSANATAESVRQVLLATDPAGYAGCCSAIRDMDHRLLLSKIRVPTLVIASDQDVSTPWEGHGEVLAASIPQAQSIRLDAAHLSNVERPSGFNAALLDFLTGDTTPPDPLKSGLAIRRAVLGDAHVDRAIANTTPLTHDFQDLITRYAWGTIWTRPGLDHRTRRLLVLAMTASIGRWEEFRLHVRTGLAAELELPDLEEVLLQVAIYAGVPAANSGFHIAAEEARPS
jgi:3-oxoadipate enol-lactonase/4-carboxymuconolactone decarboxylase